MTRRAIAGVLSALDQARQRAESGEFVGITIIGYTKEWGFSIVSAGSVVRVPGAGIAAAHLLASEMERRLQSSHERVSAGQEFGSTLATDGAKARDNVVTLREQPETKAGAKRRTRQRPDEP